MNLITPLFFAAQKGRKAKIALLFWASNRMSVAHAPEKSVLRVCYGIFERGEIKTP